MKRLLTIKEASAFLGLSEDSLKGLMRRDYIPYIKLSPRVIRLDEEDLVKLLEERKVKPHR